MEARCAMDAKRRILSWQVAQLWRPSGQVAGGIFYLKCKQGFKEDHETGDGNQENWVDAWEVEETETVTRTRRIRGKSPQMVTNG